MRETIQQSDLQPSMPTRVLRLKYEAEVAALREAVAEKLCDGAGEEDVARWVLGERNALKEMYRSLTPAPVMARIVARTMERYGSMTGPSVEELRANGKSCRPETGDITCQSVRCLHCLLQQHS